jgi:catechol 2,3-dioxygenase-like lactoylglutathione lyase family enzyme
MIAAIAPQFFTADLTSTLQYYRDKLGFETQFLYGEPPYYAGAIRDGRSIFFRRVASLAPPGPEKYAEELLDAYLIADDIDALHAEYQTRGVEFSRTIASMPWAFREFVVKDCDGRLLCFGQSTEYGYAEKNC